MEPNVNLISSHPGHIPHDYDHSMFPQELTLRRHTLSSLFKESPLSNWKSSVCVLSRLARLRFIPVTQDLIRGNHISVVTRWL